MLKRADPISVKLDVRQDVREICSLCRACFAWFWKRPSQGNPLQFLNGETNFSQVKFKVDLNMSTTKSYRMSQQKFPNLKNS